MIVTHKDLDFDAVGGVWLLKRFGGLGDLPMEFVSTGSPDPEVLGRATAVVDTGSVFDPARLRFDHHQLPGQESTATCATRQVYEHLLASGKEVAHLKPLIDLIYYGNTGAPEARPSRELGLHALLSGYKAWLKENVEPKQASDAAVLEYGSDLLNILEFRLHRQAADRANLAESIVYKSGDGRVWAIKHGSPASTWIAYEEGAVLVVFEGQPLTDEAGQVSYPIGVVRAGEWQEPHCGALVEKILSQIETRETGEFVQISAPFGNPAAIRQELRSWFRHNGGFIACRGTAKAPDARPVEVDIVETARLIDQAWQR